MRRPLACAAQTLLAGMLVIGLLAGASAYRLPAVAPEFPVAPSGVRAMWVWTAADPVEVIGWATARGVRTLFVYLPAAPPTETERARLVELRGRADAAGIAVDALGGEPSWAYDHATALAWKRTVDGLGLFRGLHVDVEPYLLPQWQHDPQSLADGLLDLLDRLADDGTRLEVDVPFWYGTVPVGAGNLADEVLARVDSVTVMSYRDTATGPNSILEVGADLLRLGERHAVPVRLAAETVPLADCPHCTFADQPEHELRRVLAEVDTAAGRFPSFAGVAVHHFGTWTALPR